MNDKSISGVAIICILIIVIGAFAIASYYPSHDEYTCVIQRK